MQLCARGAACSPPPRPSGQYLYESVLGTEARVGGGGAGVHRADVLSGPGLVAVQVKPIALGALPQVAEPWAQLPQGPIGILQVSGAALRLQL